MSSAVHVSPESLLSLLKDRRSIRRYRPDPVPDEMVENLLEAGRWAPSANNLQPWTFIVVRERAMREQIAAYADYVGSHRVHIAEAPLLIVLCGVVEDRVYREFLNGDVGMAGLQMMLQANAMGLGTCWVGGLERKAIAGMLRIPNYLEIVSLLTVGFPAEDPEPTPRKSLDEIVYYEVYGGQAGDRNTIPGVPEPLPPGPFERLLNWLRRVFWPPA
jgi:nitroreductase